MASVVAAVEANADGAAAGKGEAAVSDLLETFGISAESVLQTGAPSEELVDRLAILASGIAAKVVARRTPPSAAGPVLLTGEDIGTLSEVESELKAAAEAEDGENPFDLRGAVGRRWTKALKDEAFKASYTAVGKCYADQQRFRAAWAKKDWAVTLQTKMQRETVYGSDGDTGVYKSVAFISQQQGNDVAGVRATSNYIAKCIERYGGGILCWLSVGEHGVIALCFYIYTKYKQRKPIIARNPQRHTTRYRHHVQGAGLSHLERDDGAPRLLVD